MFPNLRAEMSRADVSTADISRATHKTDKTVLSKISGKADFTLSEVYAIRDTFFPGFGIEYLFATEAVRPGA